MASAYGCFRLCNDQLLLLTIGWLDSADLIAFDTAAQSNGRMKSPWFQVICSHPDIRPMRGLQYTSSWIWWLIDRGVRTSSILIARCTTADRVADATFEGICLPELTSIVATGGHGCDLSDATVSAIARGCVNLLDIQLMNYQRLTCESLVAIGEGCKGLTSINMSSNGNITDLDIALLIQRCRTLQSINMNDCSELTDASLAAIGEGCKGLTSISMVSNINMTSIGIANLTRSCTYLQCVQQFVFLRWHNAQSHDALSVVC